MTYGRGGVLLRRPDQRTAGTSQPGSGPAPSGMVFIGRLVIVTGASGIVGVFVYKTGTTPGLGNPPIASMTQGTTDPYGNAVVPGVCAYITVPAGIGAGRYAIDLGDQANPYANVASLTFKNLTHAPAFPPALSASTDTTHGNSISLDTGRLNAGDADAVITMQDSHLTGIVPILVSADTFTVQPVINTAAKVEIVGPAGATVLTSDAAGYLRMISTNETDQWLTGHLNPWNTADQLVNSLTFADVCNSLLPVGIGRYRYRARLTCVQGPNAVSNGYRVAFTGTIAQTRNKMPFLNVSNPASPVIAFNTSLNTLMASPAYPAATTYVADVEGTITTTAAGNLSLQAACQTNAANTFTVLAASDWHLEPA